MADTRPANERFWRRITFTAWTVLTIIVGVYLGTLGPVAEYFHENMWLVAIALPALMIALIVIGLAYLAWMSNAPSRG